MNHAINPKVAAEKARETYRKTAVQFEELARDTPEAMRALAEKSIAQTRELYERSKDALETAEATELQATYWRKQVGALTAQAEEVRTLSTQVTADVAEPIKAQVTRGADGLGRAH